jgi:murein DD-endopeptidase MepM/ murein hydrolase activator NlpD
MHRATRLALGCGLCLCAPLLSAATSPEPVLKVITFGASDTDARIDTAKFSPADFVFAETADSTAPERRFTGPVTLAQGDTWQTVLARCQVAPDAWPTLLQDLASGGAIGTLPSDWPRRPLPDGRIWIEWRAATVPAAVYLSLSPQQMLRARQVKGQLRVDAGNRVAAPALAEPVSAKFYRSADQLGIPGTVVDQMVKLFSGEIDFHRDLANGFKGTVLFEMLSEPDQPVRPGHILAVRLITPGRTLSAYSFDDSSATEPNYYSAQGWPVQRSFLQSPIVFSRITSGYSVARFHPILKLWRAHTGIDFAAPLGTPVRVTADGKVSFAGARGEYGNLVTVQHAGGWSSYYGHLQLVARGVASGTQLHQGDVLGQVGMTGMATGPHLHYEMRQGGQPFDPALFKDTTVRLNPSQLERFDHLVQWYEKQLSAFSRSHFIAP